MAENYSMKIDLDSAGFYQGIATSQKVVDELTVSLREFDSVLKSSQGDLNAAASSLTQMMAAQRAAAAAAKDLAAAQVANAKADAQAQAAADKHSESLGRQEVSAQRAGQAQEQAGLASQRANQVAAQMEQQAQAAADQHALSLERLETQQKKNQQSNDDQSKSNLELTDNLSNTRYMLYDLGATLEMTSGALITWSSAATVAAASYQKDFAQVLRISDQTLASAQSLRDGLVQLTTDIPVNFDEATQIAQLGAHLQLGNAGLVEFTDTVAKFAAATGVSVETASQMFSRMKTSMADSAQAGDSYFNKLGSSIAQMGTVVVATDSEVSSMVTNINAVTASAGIGTAATVGLAGAMASLRIQPEMARGALTRLFADFNRDSADSTQKMGEFGKVMGMTGQQASALWQQNPTQFFTQLISGLHDAYTGGQNLTVLFDQMGVKNVRDVNTLTRLAVGYNVLTKSMDAANQGYQQGTALNELSKPIFDTLAAKVEELGNAFKGFFDQIGSGSLVPLTLLADGVKNFVTGLTDLQKQYPVLTVVLNILLGFAGVAGVFLGMKAAMTFVLAGMVTFQQALGGSVAGSVSFNGVLKQLAVTMLMGKGASDELAASLVQGASGIKALGLAATTTSAQVATLSTSIEEGKVAMEEATIASGEAGLGGGFKTLLSGAMGLVGGLPGLITLVGVGLVGALVAAKDQAKQTGDEIAKAFAQSRDAGMTDVANQFNSKTADIFSLPASPGDWGKSVTQIASQVDVSMQSMLNAVADGKNGVAEFQAALDQLAQSKGFKNLDDLRNSNAPGASELQFLKNVVDDMANSNAQAATDTADSNKALQDMGVTADKVAGDVNNATSAADTLDKTIKDLNTTIFDSVDAQAALGDAADKLGQSLQKSGSFGNDANGRTNVKNYEDVLLKAQQAYGEMVKLGQMTGDQAQAAYQQFLTDLNNKVAAMGGNLGSIQQLAQQTVQQFGDAVKAYGTQSPAKVPVTADASKAQASTAVAAYAIQSELTNAAAAGKFLANIGVKADEAKGTMAQLAADIAKITGQPQDIIMDALTNPASTHALEVQQLIVDIVSGKYQASINADTQPALNNVTTFYNDAMKKLSAVQNYVNNLAATAPTLAQFGGFGATPQLTGVPYAPQAAPVADSGGAAQDVGAGVADALNLADAAANNMADGMDTAADKTAKAGKAAGNTAKQVKDLSSGLSEAAQNAEDYSNRLKTSLDHAFQMQYGVQAATDAYYQQLNKINQARQDELTKVDDLKTKIAQANDELNKDNVDASKAKMEQAISIKYGEGQRAADYGNQAQTAMDNAAAKQKEIDADHKELTATQAGIGALTGYSDAAIQNRQNLRDLEQKQLDMVVAYAKTGASVDQVRAYTANLDAQFQHDVSQLGFNQSALSNLTGDMNRYVDAVNAVPYLKPTTVTANTQPAQDALNALNDQLNAVTQPRDEKIWITGTVYKTPNFTSDGQQIYGVTDPNTGKPNGTFLFNEGGQIPGFDSGGLVPGTPPGNPRQDNLLASVDGKGMVGIRSREFIQPQEAVDYYGVSFMEDVRRMRLPKFGAITGGGYASATRSSAGGGSGVVTLDAASAAMIANALSISFNVDGRSLATAVNSHNRRAGARGSA